MKYFRLDAASTDGNPANYSFYSPDVKNVIGRTSLISFRRQNVTFCLFAFSRQISTKPKFSVRQSGNLIGRTLAVCRIDGENRRTAIRFNWTHSCFRRIDGRENGKTLTDRCVQSKNIPFVADQHKYIKGKIDGRQFCLF